MSYRGLLCLHIAAILLSLAASYPAPGGAEGAAPDIPARTAAEIRTAAILPNESPAGHPLPLASHWNTGQKETGFTPDYQIRKIEEGHHFLPWFYMPYPQEKMAESYYENGLKRAAALKLPISFLGTQWECLLTDDPRFFDLPPSENPNVVGSDGRVQKKLSPFGPVDLWRKAGKLWTETPYFREQQKLYKSPPLILFVSNNEQPKLQWFEVEQDVRYLQLHGKGRDDNYKRRIIGDAWIERYRALQEGMREGLTEPAWKSNALFVGYEAFGRPEFGRDANWGKHSLHSSGRISPWPLAWDGGSPSYYVQFSDSSADYKLWSPQIETMNYPFMVEEALRLNPRFWFEISTWDGHYPPDSRDKRRYYKKLGQDYTPSRYGGMVQFGMWLLRPRLVREFRLWDDTLANAEPYFLPIVDATDRVYSKPVLRRFWQKGRLVPNPAHKHPYVSSIPPEYGDTARWFLLDTSLDPKGPWSAGTEIPAYSLALVMGKAPRREWLVYAFSPLSHLENVKVTVPDFGNVSIGTSPSGSFYHATERGHRVVQIK
jgi:hypothetical protein